jgi:F-type H+-transporting ATPase subunit delta
LLGARQLWRRRSFRALPPHKLRQHSSLLKEDTKRVDISAGIQASLAGRYASALFDLASEKGTVTAVESDLETLRQALSESGDLRAATTNPQLSRTQQGEAVAAVARHLGLSELTTSFLGVLAGNRRLARLPDMIAAFKAIAAAQRGEVTATVTSAHPLGDDQLSALKARLTAREGRTVMLSADVDPDLLGGLVVTIGSTRIDASIRTRLNSLSQAMKA